MKRELVATFGVGFAAALAVTQTLALSKPPPGPGPGVPTHGTSTCIAGFTASPAAWDAASSPEYTCSSGKPVCAAGTKLEGNSAGGGLSGPAQTNIGYVGGKFIYKCAAPQPATVPK